MASDVTAISQKCATLKERGRKEHCVKTLQRRNITHATGDESVCDLFVAFKKFMSNIPRIMSALKYRLESSVENKDYKQSHILTFPPSHELASVGTEIRLLGVLEGSCPSTFYALQCSCIHTRFRNWWVNINIY